jgi:hypothetical protein
MSASSRKPCASYSLNFHERRSLQYREETKPDLIKPSSRPAQQPAPPSLAYPSTTPDYSPPDLLTHFERFYIRITTMGCYS